MNKVIVYDHPLILHKLGIMRDKNTCHKQFKELLQEISLLMAYELTRDIKYSMREIETPLEKMQTVHVEGQNITIIPVLRAGLGMSDSISSLIPTAKVGHLGMKRDESTLQPYIYYNHIPKDVKDDQVIITDPMLATGGSLIATIDILKGMGVKDIRILSLIAAPEGIKNIHDKHSDVSIYVAQIDRQLNDKGYILPGLGDAGDRIFGTYE